jgi:hypothetical protein
MAVEERAFLAVVPAFRIEVILAITRRRLRSLLRSRILIDLGLDLDNFLVGRLVRGL